LGKLLAEKCAASEQDESRILLLQGNLADETLLKLLPKATRWVVYETLPVSELPEWKRETVAVADAVVFASTSAVENFCSAIQKCHPERTLEPQAIGDEGSSPKELCCDSEPRLAFCIGRMTETAARKHGFETVTSDETTMDSLVKKIVEHYAGEDA
jgi:uroporphyrinogen III methyltransferase/synthase